MLIENLFFSIIYIDEWTNEFFDKMFVFFSCFEIKIEIEILRDII